MEGGRDGGERGRGGEGEREGGKRQNIDGERVRKCTYGRGIYTGKQASFENEDCV